MSLCRLRIAVAAVMSSSLLAGLALGESSGATTLDTTAETSATATPDSIVEATAPATSEAGALEILPPHQPWGGLNTDASGRSGTTVAWCSTSATIVPNVAAGQRFTLEQRLGAAGDRRPVCGEHAHRPAASTAFILAATDVMVATKLAAASAHDRRHSPAATNPATPAPRHRPHGTSSSTGSGSVNGAGAG
jgi:hypothetical protein